VQWAVRVIAANEIIQFEEAHRQKMARWIQKISSASRKGLPQQKRSTHAWQRASGAPFLRPL